MSNIKITFFDNQLNECQSTGIYLFRLINAKGMRANIYIGQSKTPMKRASEHLYDLHNSKGPGYFGLFACNMKDPTLELQVILLENCNDEDRFDREKYYITKLKPMIQYSTNDNQFDKEKKIKKVQDFLSLMK